METSWKSTVSVELRAIRLKFNGNCAFPQNFHTKKLSEILVFYRVRGAMDDLWRFMNNNNQNYFLKKNCIYYGSATYIYKCIFLLNSDKWALIRGTIKFSIFRGFYVKDFPAALTNFYHLALLSTFLIALIQL